MRQLPVDYVMTVLSRAGNERCYIHQFKIKTTRCHQTRTDEKAVVRVLNGRMIREGPLLRILRAILKLLATNRVR